MAKRNSVTMQNIVAAAVVVFVSLINQQANALSYCPPEWQEYNYACHYFNPTPLTWQAAEAACNALVPGAHLTQPRDGGEYNYIQTMRSNLLTQTPWIGMRFNTTFNQYTGVNGIPSGNWAYGPPWAQLTNSDGYCAQLRANTWTWQTALCTQLNPSICMFYTLVSQINVEMMIPFNRLYGAMDWFGYRNGWQAFEDGQFYNVSLADGPTGAPDTAIQLNAATKSYVSFVNNTNPGVNYQGRDFVFMFYIYRTVDSVGPIIQYRYNQSHYGFNIWSFANGSLLVDFVRTTVFGPVPDPGYQVYVPPSCAPLNQWNFLTVQFWLGNNGLVYVRNGANVNPCVQLNLGPLQLEMSRGFDIGRRQMPMPTVGAPVQWPSVSSDSATTQQQTYNGDAYLTARIGCFISGGDTVVNHYYSAEAMLWCQQALQETTGDRTMAKRLRVVFPRESNLVGMWPLNEFYRSREAVGRNFIGNISSNYAPYGLGPSAEMNGSLVFDGTSTFVTLNGQPNQVMLAPAFTFLRRSFAISTWLYRRTINEGGPIASFQDDNVPPTLGYMSTMITLVPRTSNINVIIPALGGYSILGNLTFTNCVIPVNKWHHISVIFSYSDGAVSVYIDGSQCGTSQTIGNLQDIEADTNIIVGRSSYGQMPFAFFKGKLSCFTVHSDVLSVTDIQSVMASCHDVLVTGVTRDKNLLFKPQHLRFFLPLGRQYDLQDVSGRQMHGQTRGFLGTATGPLGHPHSATRFYHEPNSAIDLQSFARENPYELGSNDSVTYMGYIYSWPNRDNNLPWDHQNIFQHWDQSNGGRGLYFMTYRMNYQMHFYAQYKGRGQRYSYPSVYAGANMASWQWFVLRYSKLTRKITISLNGNQIYDETFGWFLINTYSALRIGALTEDSCRWTGKMACMMMYDLDMRDDEIAEARNMCHNFLMRAYGPPVDTTKCYHSTYGWEYNGKVSWTANNRLCRPWTNQTTYTDGTAFPDGSLVAAASYCRNPDLYAANNRTKPWCYTYDPLVPWEFCNIPVCGQTNVPFHNAEQVLAYWPLGKTFTGMDVTGSGAHARVGAEATFTANNGPFGIQYGGTNFTYGTSTGHYWVQQNGYNNMYDLLDIGSKPFLRGYSYTIMALYPSGLTGNGAFWSWESNNGDGGAQGLQFRFSGNSFLVFACDKNYRVCRNFQCPSNLLANTWYQFAFVLDKANQKILLYQDMVLCYSTNFPEVNWNDGLYTLTGSFKFGAQMYQPVSGVSAACAAVYTQVLIPNDLAVIGSKCKDIVTGRYTDYLLGGIKPIALWPMSSHTEGMNTRNLNHARFSMVTPVTNQFGVVQGGYAFPGSGMQYFWAAQDYIRNLDVCQMSRSFTMSTYAYVQGAGTAFAFHTQMSNIDDNNNAIGRGNQLAFLNTPNDVYFSMNDGASLLNPIKTGANTYLSTWVHITVSYDFRADNFLIYTNGTLIYNQPNVRNVYCQTSGAVSMARTAFRPLTLPYSAQPMTGALSCAQLYPSGMLSEAAVQRTQRYCSHPDYVGCYPAHPAVSTDFVFNPGFWNSTNVTIAICRRSCGANGYRFAALRNGTTCLCGNTYGSDGPEAPHGCNIKCLFRANDWCGGLRHFSVYRTNLNRNVKAPRIKSVDYIGCPAKWSLRGSNCYRIFENRLSMLQAVDACALNGAQLATVSEVEENTFIAAIAPAILQASDYICLGVNASIAGQSKAYNMDNKPFFYANWASGQPSYQNYWGCMLFSNRLWYAQNPTNQLYYACKKPAGPYSDGLVPAAMCAPGWTRFNDSCYLFQISQVPYRFAETICSSYIPKASLVKVTSHTQFVFVQNLTDWQHPFWIGLEYSSTYGDYVWTKDNTTLNTTGYSLWAGDLQLEMKQRRCAFADSRTQYDWRTGDCETSLRHSFVCQQDILPTSGLIGLSSGRIVKAQLSASSTASASAIDQARVGGDSAWCANTPTDTNPWLAVDLAEPYRIYEMWFQGNPAASEWITYAKLEYSNDYTASWTTFSYASTGTRYFNGATWAAITSPGGPQQLPINTDSSTLRKIAFDAPGLLATNIRITALNYSVRACLRLEFNGTTTQGSGKRTLKLPLTPIRFELDRNAGSGVRYTVTTYVDDLGKPTLLRWSPTGIVPETVTGFEYIYQPRHIGRQKIVFGGTDAEGGYHELSYEMATMTRVKSLLLNMCPSAVLYDTYAACEFRIVGATAVNVTIDYGFDHQGPRLLRSSRVEVGTTTAPVPTSTNIDSVSYIYLMPNQPVRQNATVYAIEAVITTPGWVTIQLYKPYCNKDTSYFCAVCHCCIAYNVTCNSQRAYDSYKCGVAVKDPWAGCSNLDTMSKKGFFDTNNPKVDYQFVTEWRKYFTATGSQVVYLDESEQMELTLGMIMAYYRNASDTGQIQVYTSSTIKEFFFLDSAPNYATRLTTTSNFTILRTSATQTMLMHMVKLITMSSIGVSFGRKWTNIAAGTQLININVQDVNFAAAKLNMSYSIEVQYRCLNYTLIHPALVNATTSINFTVPDHVGTACQYLIDWGDETDMFSFDISTRNSTFHHIYKLDGTYTITFYAWNLVYSSSTWSTINVVFPIQKMSMFMANPPATEITQYSAGVITFGQASSAYSVIDVDANRTSALISEPIVRTFALCPSGWVSGTSEISVDACYRYFYQYQLTFDRAMSFCASQGGTLAFVNGGAELDFLKVAMTTAGGPTDSGAWVGYSQIRDGFNFWVSEEGKSSVPSPFWQETSGQYPVSGGGTCGYYDYASRRLQNDPCTVMRPFICKRETAVAKFCGPVNGWYYDAVSNRCFRAFTTLSTYLSATASCRQIGGQLAIPDSLQALTVIQKLAKNANPSYNYYMAMWRSSGPAAANFKFYDGWQEFTPPITKWDVGQPTTNQGENCVILRPLTGLWKVVTCSDMDGFVCEKPVYGSKANRYAVRTASRRYVVPTKQSPSCPGGWTLSPTTQICYKLITTLKNWNDAEAYCLNTYSAHLAKIHTENDHQVFWNQVVGSKALDIWIGFIQLSATPTASVWRDGSSTAGVKLRWDNGQPIVVGPGYAYYPASTPAWRTSSGANLYAFACSKPALTDWKTWAGNCPNGWIEYAGRCFLYDTTSAIQTAASTSCKNVGGGLARILSYEDLVFLRGLLPFSANTAWIGLNGNSGIWKWEADVRGKSISVNYNGMWNNLTPAPLTPPITASTPSCAVLSRPDSFNVSASLCSATNAFICEQPAAICPVGWKIWAGACYRVFPTQLHIQPGTDYDTARAACQFEDSLPVSPVNKIEHAMISQYVVDTVGTGKAYGHGYRRFATSKGFIDMSGRISYYSGNATGLEAGSGNFYAYSVTPNVNVTFTSDLWTDASVCQAPSQVSADTCIRECLATSEFNCKTVYYNGLGCQFTPAYAPNNWYGLRETFGEGDIYSLRTDICSDNLIQNALSVTSSESTPITIDDLQLKANYSTAGFSAADGNDTLLIEFPNTVWLNSLAIGKRDDGSSHYITTFKVGFTFDRGNWFSIQDPPGTDKVFTANNADDEVVMIKLPKPILLKALRILPITWSNTPSYRLRLIGCDGAMFSDYADFKYLQPGTYVMLASAYSPQNNVTTSPITIDVQSKITNVTLPNPPPLPYGSAANLKFAYFETAPYAFPIANGTFNGFELQNLTLVWTKQYGVGLVGADVYPGIGQFPVEITVDNLLSDPFTLKTRVEVDFAVTNLSIKTSATEDHGALVDEVIQVNITMANCSRCNVTVDYGSPSMHSPEGIIFRSYDYVPAYTPLDIPSVIYNDTNRGRPYIITVSANNFLPYQMTTTYEIYIQRPPDEKTFSYEVSRINKITLGGPAEVVFKYKYTGRTSRWPTIPKMGIDYQDNTNDSVYTAPFLESKLPPPTATDPDPMCDKKEMAVLTHSYSKSGFYSVPMWVFNRVGMVGITVNFTVEEVIDGLRIVPNKRYVLPGEPILFNVTWRMGTNFLWQVMVPNPDNTTDWTPVYNSTFTQFTYTFTQVGSYFLAINGSNPLVDSIYGPVALEPCCPIVVQYPVQQYSYRLTTFPATGRLLYNGPDDDIGHADTVFRLWFNPNLNPQPSAPYIVMDYGDTSDGQNVSLTCNEYSTEILDGPWKLCKEMRYSYTNVTTFYTKAIVSNMASSQTFTTSFVVFVSVSNLRLDVKYAEDEEHPTWIQGYPRIDPKVGPKSYSMSFFPTGYPLRIVAQAKKGEGLRYCFFSSVEGNITNCEGIPSSQATPNSVIRKFQYDTPCGSRLERCGLTLSVVASNPIDTATASINIFLQKPAKGMKVLQYGPAMENSTFPLWLAYDQFGTDACIQVDYGTPMILESGQKRLFGSEYMCADSHTQDEMASLKSFSADDIGTKALGIGGKFYRRGIYTVKVTSTNFVSTVNPEMNPAMQVPVVVTKGPCSSPLLFVDTAAQSIYKKDEFRLPAYVKMNCSASKAMSLNHTITFQAKGSTSWVEIGSKYFTYDQLHLMLEGSIQNPVKQDVSLTFRARTVDYGKYRFTMDCSMVEEIGINSTLKYEIEVIASDLVVGILPSGSRQELVYGKPVKINAYNLSYDPDIADEAKKQEGIDVFYFCKRDCDGDWPQFTSNAMIADFIADPSGFRQKYNFAWRNDICVTNGETTLMLINYDVNGCFMKKYHSHRDESDPPKFDFPSLNQPAVTRHLPEGECGENATAAGCDIKISWIGKDNSLTIDTSYQFENMTYNLMAIVRKGDRYGISRQTYRLERGEAPQPVVATVTNCAYPSKDAVIYNPTSRASFHGLISGRVPGIPYFFGWHLIKIPPTTTTAYALDNMDKMRDTYSWPEEYWINKTTTGRYSDDLSIERDLFTAKEHYGNYYMTFVEVTRGNNPRKGVSSLTFVINEPPNAENATCTANYYIGYAMNTSFQFYCSGITSKHGPVTRYVFSMQACSHCPLVALTPTIGIPQLKAGIKLPAGVAEENFTVTIYLDAFDMYDSMQRIKMKLVVLPLVDLATIKRQTTSYITALDMMMPQDLCQQMFTFSSLMNYYQLDPVYTPNKTAYAAMSNVDKGKEDRKVEQDKVRYDDQLATMMAIRDNITIWIYNAVAKKGLQKDPNQVKTCCSALTSVLDAPEQASGKVALDNAIQALGVLTANLTTLASSPTRDADRFDEASTACTGVIGMLSSAMNANLQLVRAGPAQKSETGTVSSTIAKAFADRYGTLPISIARSRLHDEMSEAIYSIVLGGKVLREAATVLSAPGMKGNLQQTFIKDMNNTIIPTGLPTDCGSFRLGDATKVFLSAGASSSLSSGTTTEEYSSLDRLLNTNIRLKSSMAEGNHLAFDSTADTLNSQVQSLQFINGSSGAEIVIKNLPFEIDITVESKNTLTPESTQLTSLTNAYPRAMKSMVMNISALSALFITVERWNLPNMCNNSHLLPSDIALNATCSGGNVTTLIYENVNYTVPSLNVTDEDVIFFVYAKYNGTPTESTYDLGCTLPRMAFENELEYALGNPIVDYYTTISPTAVDSGETPATIKQQVTTTTPAPTTSTPSTVTTGPAPECKTLSVLNVTCCNGTYDEYGYCDGGYVLPTTPAPTVITPASKTVKNCTRPSQLNINSCFFDHRKVDVMENSRLFKIGVRAIPRSTVRQYLQQLVANEGKLNVTLDLAINKTMENIIGQSVRVGYKYQAFTASCKFFDPKKNTWSSEGCRVGELSTPGGNPSLTQCLCNHLTSFSSGFDVPMNMFDPRDSAFTKLDQNPICFTFGICIICCFFSVLIWARKRDKEDEKKWGTTPLADNDPRDKYAYELTIWTGQRSGAGTSARVSFILRGDENETPVHMLEDDERDVLQRSGIDSFLLLTPRSLGKLVQLRIWHDNSGQHPNWYFSRMQVQDLQRNRQYYFLCDRWLAIDEDDGMVERILPVAGKKELAGFEHIFFTRSRRKLTDGHIWISVFSRPPLSKFTRCQRLTCCLTVLYCTMLANIMFYGQQKDPPGGIRFEFGPVSMSLNKIFMSVVSALIVMPMNIIIVQLFRMSKHRPTKNELKMEELRAKAIKAEEAERKKLLASGQAAPPQQVGVTSVSGDVANKAELGGVIMPKKVTRKADKLKKQKKPFKLPWWCIIVAYVLAACTCAVAFWAIVEFGGALGPEKAQQWVVSMIISLVTDIVFMQPVKILALVMFYALIIKSPTKDEDIEEKAMLKDDEVFLHDRPSEAEMIERKKNFDMEKKDYVFLPPDLEELKLAREVRMKEKQMWKIIKEIAFYVMFLYLLMMVAFATQDDWSMYLQKQMRNVYLSGGLASAPYNESDPAQIEAYNPDTDPHEEVFGNIMQDSQVFTFLERTLIPSILDGSWYNGAYDSLTDKFTSDQALYLAGSLRIRQVRVRDDACRIPKNFRQAYTQKCLAPYSIFNDETRNFTAGWQLAPFSNTTMLKGSKKFMTMGDPRGFAYTSDFDDRGLPFQALLTTYNGGGYIVDLGRTVEGALAKINFLKENRWIDDKTRAVFIEFNLYCPNRNLWAMSQTVVEFFAGGSTVLYPYFYVTKLDPYFGTFALVLLGFEFLTLAIVVWLFAREIGLAMKYKRAYWMDAWAVLEFVHLLSCIVMAIMFIIRYAMSRAFVGSDFNKETFTNFTVFITYDQMVQCFMGFILFVAFVKMVRLLRFNRRLVIMLSTLRHVRANIVSFFVVFFVAYLAFAQMGVLAFGTTYGAYSNFVSALESLFSMLLGTYDIKSLTADNRFVGQFFFVTFSVTVNIFLVNVFIALLMFSYEEVRADATKRGNDFEIVDFMMNKFKAMVGLAPKRATTLSVDKRFAYVDAAMHEDEIDKFTSRMDELMTKLDQHLEKTKTQFSGLFDQRFMSRKQREIYVTD